jgi:hypothetical protein
MQYFVLFPAEHSERGRSYEALQTSFGAWKDEDHPELREGTEAFIRNLRKSGRLDGINRSR